MAMLKGAVPIVQVQSPTIRALEAKARDVMVGRSVTEVFLSGEQLLVVMEDGGRFAINHPGGFEQVS